MIDTIGSHVRTDLSTEEMARLAEILKDVDTSKVRSKVIDAEDIAFAMDFFNMKADGVMLVVGPD